MRIGSSLRRSLIMLSMGILALYYALVCLFSVLFMEPYYLHNVESRLVSAFHTLEHMEELDYETIALLEESNITIVIAQEDNCAVVYNSQFADRFMAEMQARILPGIREAARASDTGYYILTDEMSQRTTSGANIASGKRVMLGGVTEHYLVDLSTSYASISQATTISVQFSLIVGLMVMILAVLAFSRMATSLTGPVTQITNIARQIANLDFSQKCDVSTGGEIGIMAESVNTMSDFMQTYTTQLQEANEQLKEDIRQKKEQEEARKNLVSNLSHDLKTPIGLISGYADGLRQGMARTEDEVREYCDVICDESDRMMNMIQRMMELFRLESGTVTPEHEEFDLADLLNYVVEIFAIEIERAGLEFTHEYEDGLYICSDYFCVEQVMTNYMQNAISHISQGNKLHLWVEDREDRYRVNLYNSSVPIPEAEIPRIWDSFYRLDKARSERRSGLGLSIVRSNMELLGGSYGVENTDSGVTFWAEFQKSEAE